MVAVGEANGLHPTTAFITDMNHPIGSAVGNWVEIRECIHVLKGNLKEERLSLSQDLITLVVVQAGQMLFQSQYDENSKFCREENGSKRTLQECIEYTYKVLDSGRALEKFRQMLLAQGADPAPVDRALETPDNVPLASYVATWTCDTPGFIHDIPAKTIGEISVLVGAGRTAAGQSVDGQAGLVFYKKVDDFIRPGDVVVKVYTNQSQEEADDALECVKEAVIVHAEPPSKRKGPIITHYVTKNEGTLKFVIPSFLD
jgi:pyrimidine-nucleoside phosphorylase